MTKIKQYRCPHCSAEYVHGGSIISHLVEKHDYKPFQYQSTVSSFKEKCAISPEDKLIKKAIDFAIYGSINR
jgi:hypothetical protein